LQTNRLKTNTAQHLTQTVEPAQEQRAARSPGIKDIKKGPAAAHRSRQPLHLALKDNKKGPATALLKKTTPEQEQRGP